MSSQLEELSRPRPPFPLYQDLIDSIIDFLQDDRQSLCTCSLVGRGWGKRSRKHLFSTISVNDSDPGFPAMDATTFFETFVSSPHLAQCVVTLKIFPHFRLTDTIRAALRPTFAGLVSLQRLSLDLAWHAWNEQVDPSMRIALLEVLFPTVKHLTLRVGTYPPSIIYSLDHTSLHSLTLDNMSFGTSHRTREATTQTIPGSSQGTALLALQSGKEDTVAVTPTLLVLRGPSSSTFIATLLTPDSPVSFSRLTRLCLKSQTAENSVIFPSLNIIFKQAADTLEDLQLWCFINPSTVGTVDLSPLKQLRSLDISASDSCDVIEEDVSFNWNCHVLESLSPTNIVSSITLHLAFRGPSPELGYHGSTLAWSELNRVLALPHIRSSITLGARSWLDGPPRQVLEEFLETQLSSVVARKLLTIRWDNTLPSGDSG